MSIKNSLSGGGRACCSNFIRSSRRSSTCANTNHQPSEWDQILSGQIQVTYQPLRTTLPSDFVTASERGGGYLKGFWQSWIYIYILYVYIYMYIYIYMYMYICMYIYIYRISRRSSPPAHISVVACSEQRFSLAGLARPKVTFPGFQCQSVNFWSTKRSVNPSWTELG